MTGLSYLNQVVQESLRFSPPIPQATFTIFSKDTKVGKYNIKANTQISINFMMLQHNSNEWRDPYSFKPERFDSNNELSLTPAGKKRNVYSFTPFNGGRRICFGKTFADANMKIFAIYASQYFNFKFVKDDYSANHLPLLHLGMSHTIPLEI